MADRSATASGSPFRMGDWRVDPGRNSLRLGEREVRLEPRVMDLLVFLAERPGSVVSKQDLLDGVWGAEYLSDNTLTHAISQLRRELGDDPRVPRYIETIPKRGYRLLAPVAALEPAVQPPPGRRVRRSATLWVAALAGSAAAVGLLALAVGWPGLASPEEPPGIVVLPFENLGPEDERVFVDGVTEEVISRLGAVRGLRVVSRTSAFNYDITGRTVGEIGRELGVDYVLEGSVRWSGAAESPQVRVSTQLIRVADDSHLWSEQLDREAGRALQVQAEVAQRVVESLDVRLLRHESDVLARTGTDVPGAYAAFVRAKARAADFDRASSDMAVALLQRAVALDPGYASAWASLAEAHAAVYHFRYDHTPERAQMARAALARAFALGDGDGEAERARGYVEHHCAGDRQRALAAFERALDLRPNDERVMTGIAFVLRRMGRLEEAVDWFDRALRLDPLNPTTMVERGSTLHFLRRYEEAVASFDRAIELGPDLRLPYRRKAVTLWTWRGDTGAVAALLAQLPGPPDDGVLDAGITNAAYGRRWREAAVAAEELSRRSPRAWVERCTIAEALGDAGPTCREALLVVMDLRRAAPEDATGWVLSSRILAALGRSEEAVAAADRASRLLPVERDAITGTQILVERAKAYARAGRTAEALEQVERLLEMPSDLSPALLRLDPAWDPLRAEPRFERLVGGG